MEFETEYRIVEVDERTWWVVKTEIRNGDFYKVMTFKSPDWSLIEKISCESLNDVLTPSDYENW